MPNKEIYSPYKDMSYHIRKLYKLKCMVVMLCEVTYHRVNLFCHRLKHKLIDIFHIENIGQPRPQCILPFSFRFKRRGEKKSGDEVEHWVWINSQNIYF